MHGHGRREEPHTLAQQRRYRQLCAALAKVMPFDDGNRRDVTERVCGKSVRSTRGLSRADMARVIDAVSAETNRAGQAVREGARRPRT